MLLCNAHPALKSRLVRVATASLTAFLIVMVAARQEAEALPASSASKPVLAPGQAANEIIDVRARRRVVRRGNRNNDAAARAFFGLALGTIGAVVAEQRRKDYYRQQYYYGGNPYYGGRYYGAPGYYGGGPYYGY